MNIIRKLTQRFLKLNRTRTLVTIIGVIISTAMITAVPTLMMSFLKAYQQNGIDDYGNWHVQYLEVENSAADRLAKDENTAWVSTIKLDGFAELEDSRSSYQPYLAVISLDKNAMGTLGIKLTEGRLPSSPDEAVISVEAIRLGGMEVKLGDHLGLAIGKRFRLPDEFQGETELGLNKNYYLSADGVTPLEELRIEQTIGLEVVGFIERPPIESYFNPGFSVIRSLDASSLAPKDTVDLMVTWKKVDQAANTRANQLGYDLNLPAERIVYNTPLVQAYGLLSLRNMATLYMLVAVLVVVIVIGSVFLISNAFNISVVERSRQYGLLASVGATVSQKKQAVYSEAWLIALVAIPIGILAGIAGIALTLRYVEPMINQMMNGTEMNLVVTVTPGLILVAALFALLIIFLSAFAPARRAAKVSPINAIRQTQDIKIKSSQVKTPRLVRFLFGFEGELALKNIKRNSKGYTTTILSLVVSIVLFLGVFSLARYSYGAMSTKVVDFTFPISVMVNSNISDEEKNEFFEEILKLDGVTKGVVYHSTIQTLVLDSDKLPVEMAQVDWRTVGAEVAEGEMAIPSNFEVIPEAYFKEVLEENGIAPMADQVDRLEAVMINPLIKDVQNGTAVESRLIDVKAGESFDMELLNYDNVESKEIFELASLQVIGFVNYSPLDDGLMMSHNLHFLVSDKDFQQMTSAVGLQPDRFMQHFVLRSDNSSKTVEEIRDLQLTMRTGETFITDRNSYQQSNYNMRVVMNVFFYGFVVLIALIGLTNILNTILTGMRLRSREFAMLRSVGMTPGSFNRMLQFESLYFGVMALLFGLPLGIGLNFVFFLITRRSFDVHFQLPWLAMGIVVAVVLLVTMVVMQFSSRQAKKANIVETMRMEAI